MIEYLASRWEHLRQRNTAQRATLWRAINLLLTAAMVGYLVYAYSRGEMRATLKYLNWKAYGKSILLMLGLYLLSLGVQFAIWVRIIAAHHRSGWLDMAIYARMLVLRGLPGGIWHWLGRISMYVSQTAIPPRTVTLANFLEWAVFTLCGLSFYALTLPLWPLGGGLFLAASGCALWLVFQWLSSMTPARRLLEGVLWLVAYLSAWALGGLILHLSIRVLTPAYVLSPALVFRAWGLTGSLGMLTALLPSSFGVREVTLLWALQAYMSPSLALLIGLFIRALYALADTLWGLAGWLGYEAGVRLYGALKSKRGEDG